ncbi:MAG: hypothetical protein D6680_03165 [Cyanobacteria bacterium J007]|nr:MAG: hypothetical protein D6680_03165 [Cyanobacteria bacterium J007]
MGVSFRDRNGSEKAEAAIAFVFSDFLISSNSPGDFAGTEGEAAAIAPPEIRHSCDSLFVRIWDNSRFLQFSNPLEFLLIFRTFPCLSVLLCNLLPH